MKKHKLGVILAGGKSRRFGAPKAFAEREGKKFYEYSLQALMPHTDSQVIITSAALMDRFTQTSGIGLKVYTDQEPFAGKGPLAGLYTAMENERAEWYVTIPIDVPFMEAWVYEALLAYADEQTDAVIPVTPRKHPLIAVYNYSIKNQLQENLENEKLSVRELLEKIRVKFVPVNNEKPFININSQEDFKKSISTD